MQVAADVYVVGGRLRWAGYDIKNRVCIPLTEEEVHLLRVLASGNNISFSGRDKAAGATLQRLRLKGLVVPGRPVIRSLDFPVPSVPERPESFQVVWLEITNACNLSCTHCYADSSPSASRKGELTVDQWKTVIDKFIDYGTRTITLIGGEPLIAREKVEHVIRHARSRDANVQLGIFSNLTLMPRDENWIELLRDCNVSIATSIYGMYPAAHEETTGGHNAWKKTVEAIEILAQAGMPPFVGVYANHAGGENYETIAQWLRELGVTRFNITAPSQVGRGIQLQWKKPIRRNTLPQVKHFADHDPIRNAVVHNCFFDHITVKPDGFVLPCIMTRKTQGLNIFEHSIGEYLDSELYRHTAYTTKEAVEGCRECEFRYGCFDCRPDAIGRSGDWYSKPHCGYDPRLELGEEIREYVLP